MIGGVKGAKTVEGARDRAIEERVGILLGERGDRKNAAVRVKDLPKLVAEIIEKMEREKAAAAPPDEAEFGTVDFHDSSADAGFNAWGTATRWRPPNGRAGPAVLMKRRSGAGVWIAAEASGGRGNNEPKFWLKGSSGQAGDFGPWREVYHQSSIVGAVSMDAGGIPDGAIIETNAGAASAPNGRYVRFADGHQICRFSLTFSAAIATAHFGGFRSAVQSWTFPMPFDITPLVVAQVGDASAFGAGVDAVSPTTAEVYSTAITSQGSADRVLNLIAIGRWAAPPS